MKILSNKLLFATGLFCISLLMSPISFAKDLISFEPFKKIEFSPSRQQIFNIPFKLNEAAQVDIQIYTCDGNLVRELSSGKTLDPGGHLLKWDGKDHEGEIVPDEAYTLVLHAGNKAQTSIIDPREESGGEVEKTLATVITEEGKIVYTLSKLSRVQIRAGIVDGPMLRSLVSWQPRPAGKNIHQWNGFDADKIINLFSIENYGVSVTAFNLPDYTILTTGNSSIGYPEYYKKKKWTFTPVPLEKQQLERNNKGLSPHYYLWRVTDKDPRLTIILPDSIKKSEGELPILQNNEPIPVKVTMAAEDEQFMAETKYEVSFFVDFEFRSEEELGFMPITWLWRPNNLAKGEHALTVNVSGFRGQVGVKNIKFLIE